LYVIIIIIIIIIVVIIIISLMQGFHIYILETNHVSRVHSVTASLRVLLMVHRALSAILHSFVLLLLLFFITLSPSRRVFTLI
jgi:hypothetical protein